MYKFEINFKEVLGNMSKISNVDKKKEIIGVILILIALLLLIGFYSNTDAFLLVFIRNLVNNGIGVGGYVLPIIVGFIGIGLITKKKISNLNKKFYALISFLIMIYLIISLVTLDKFNGKTYLSTLQAVMSSTSNFHGGVLGITVMRLFKSFIGFAGSLALLITILVISIILIFDKSLYDIAQIIKKKINRISNKRDDINSKSKLDNLTNTKNNDINFNKKKKSNASIVKFLSKSLSLEEPQEISNIIKKEPDVEFAEEVCEEPIVKNVVEEDIVKENYNKNELISNDLKKTYEVKNEYKRISYDDINNALEDTDINDFNEVSEELKRKKDLLQKTLDDFKVKAEIKNVQKGPAVTRYEIEPHKGVKVSKILNLSD